MTGATIDRYEIHEKLGSGGMDVGFRATDIRLGLDVALKFLPDRVGADPVAKRRLWQEARAASALEAPEPRAPLCRR